MGAGDRRLDARVEILDAIVAIMAGDVIALMDHLGIERADIMGYSMGARVALAPLGEDQVEFARAHHVVLLGSRQHHQRLAFQRPPGEHRARLHRQRQRQRHMVGRRREVLAQAAAEPPPNVVFIMATTELHKVPDTITSRSQEFVFRTIPPTGKAGRNYRPSMKRLPRIYPISIPPRLKSLTAWSPLRKRRL